MSDFPQANFPEEERLLCRTYRLLTTLKLVARTQRWRRRRLANDLDLISRLTSSYAVVMESQLYHPNLFRVWKDREAKQKPPPRLRLLLHLLTDIRRACSDVILAHDQAVALEGMECCDCGFCDDVKEYRYFMGYIGRMLSTIFKGIQKGVTS